jgi:glutaminyl-tRNA synthetase
MATNDTEMNELAAKFKATGLNDKQAAEALKSKLIRASFDKLIDESPKEIPQNPTTAGLLLALATATQKGSYDSRPKITQAIIDGRIKSAKQVEGIPFEKRELIVAAVDYMKTHDKIWVETDFENASGIGITVTEGEIKNIVQTYISTNKDKILKERYLALPPTLKEMATNPFLKWADAKLRAEIVNKEFEALLGPKDKQPAAPAKKKVISRLNTFLHKGTCSGKESSCDRNPNTNRTRHTIQYVQFRMDGKSS